MNRTKVDRGSPLEKIMCKYSKEEFVLTKLISFVMTQVTEASEFHNNSSFDANSKANDLPILHQQ